MQCKNMPDKPVLQFLKQHGGIGCNAWSNDLGEPFNERSVLHAMPDSVPQKLAVAKMVMLKRRNLVNGCGCGCRGDWELTEKGKQFLIEPNN